MLRGGGKSETSAWDIFKAGMIATGWLLID